MLARIDDLGAVVGAGVDFDVLAVDLFFYRGAPIAFRPNLTVGQQTNLRMPLAEDPREAFEPESVAPSVADEEAIRRILGRERGLVVRGGRIRRLVTLARVLLRA